MGIRGGFAKRKDAGSLIRREAREVGSGKGVPCAVAMLLPKYSGLRGELDARLQILALQVRELRQHVIKTIPTREIFEQ